MDSKNFILFNEPRNFDIRFAAAETLWYLSGSESLSWMTKFCPNYGRYVGNPVDDVVEGAYGPRVERVVWNVIKKLRYSSGSRQATIPIFSHKDVTVEDGPSVPCTLTWQFLLRDEALHMVVNMRSNDVWRGTPNDVFAFCVFLHSIAASVGVPSGNLYLNVGSLHVYERDTATAILALEDRWFTIPKNEGQTFYCYSHAALMANDAVRTNKLGPIVYKDFVSDLYRIVRNEPPQDAVLKHLWERKYASP